MVNGLDFYFIRVRRGLAKGAVSPRAAARKHSRARGKSRRASWVKAEQKQRLNPCRIEIETCHEPEFGGNYIPF